MARRSSFDDAPHPPVQYNQRLDRPGDKDLHKQHPKLGHQGLLHLLEQAGMHVDQEELDRFMKENHIRAEKPWRPWRWRGASWPFGHG